MDAKGAAHRLIKVPGYNLRPKYDLPRLRERMLGNSEREYDAVLPLTSMIDMFSMLVIFLLLNFSATGEAYFVNKDIKLPEAINIMALESLPLISITRDSVSLDAAVVGYNPTDFTLKGSSHMPGLVASLQSLKVKQDALRAVGIKPKTEINIQADQGTPVIYIKRVMNILITEGYTGINFAVIEPDPGS